MKQYKVSKLHLNGPLKGKITTEITQVELEVGKIYGHSTKYRVTRRRECK